MRFGFVASLLLHVLVLAAGYLFLPTIAPKAIETPFVPISIIEKAEIADELSVPESAPKVAPEPPKEELTPAPEEPKPAPPTPEPAPPEPKPEPAPPETAPAPKAAEKPPVKPEKPQPKKTADLDLDALSAVVNKEKQKAPNQTAPRESDRAQQRIGLGDKLTATEEAKMQAAIRKCWNLSAIAGAPNAKALVVVAAFELNRNGTLAGPPRAVNGTEIDLSGNRFWKAAEQSALRAIVQCQPYNFLSAERYDTWREMELNFDPSIAAGY